MEVRLSGTDQSLNAPISGENEGEWQTFLSDERPNPEDIAINMKDGQTRSQWLNEALGELSDRERKIITERHLGQDVVTLEDLGHQLGVSKERIRQLEARAMEKIKESLLHHVSDGKELLMMVCEE
jgi:RNA polymerase sigma-32 factor